MNLLRVALCVLACAYVVRGKLALHNPRGSNNRLSENGSNRNNANRIFNSQNNAQGGYCWGPAMTYVEGSLLTVEWSSLNGCGIDNNCVEVLQYMCTDSNSADTIRDGTTTDIIPTSNYNEKSPDTGEYIYGMAEPYSYYSDCQKRTRNKGLFTAHGPLNEAAGAMATRQNPNAGRYGFECSEERDYYPYWHPSPWKDIAVFTSDTSDCSFYQAESQNVKAKNFCTGTSTPVPNNQADCQTAKGTWNSTAAFGLTAPACMSATSTQNNDFETNNPRNFTWKLPTSAKEPCIATNSCSCMLRLRYNVTDNLSKNVTGTFLDSSSPVRSPTDTLYTLEETGDQFYAVTANIGGRTYEDRSFTFHITSRPANIPSDANIYNLNVKGKRGNSVQVFPSTMYQFVPQNLQVIKGDFIHFQWTGCDQNPANYAGSGKYGTDRTNIVQISDRKSNTPLDLTGNSGITPLFEDLALRRRMANIDQTNCLDAEELLQAETNNGLAVEDNPQNCMLLNAAQPYFSGALVAMNHTGTFHYMCTRNNNFSNRFQKGTIIVN